MKKILIYVAVFLAAIFLLGSLGAINIEKFKPDEPTVTTPSTGGSVQPEFIPSRDALLGKLVENNSYKFVNKICGEYDDDLGYMKIVSDYAVDYSKEPSIRDDGAGWYYNVSNNYFRDNPGFSYLTDVLVSFAVFVDSNEDPGAFASDISFGICCGDEYIELLYVEQNTLYASDSTALISSIRTDYYSNGVDTISLHINTDLLYVDIYIDNVMVHSMNLKNIDVGSEITSAFYAQYGSAADCVNAYFENVLIKVPDVNLDKLSLPAVHEASTYLVNEPGELVEITDDYPALDCVSDPDGLWTDRY